MDKYTSIRYGEQTGWYPNDQTTTVLVQRGYRERDRGHYVEVPIHIDDPNIVKIDGQQYYRTEVISNEDGTYSPHEPYVPRSRPRNIYGTTDWETPSSTIGLGALFNSDNE